VRLFAALVVGVEEVLIVLVGGKALVDDEDDGGDEDDRDEELAIVDTEGLGNRRGAKSTRRTRISSVAPGAHSLSKTGTVSPMRSGTAWVEQII